MKKGDVCTSTTHKPYRYKILEVFDYTVIAKDMTYETIEILEKKELEVEYPKGRPTIEDVKAKLTLEEMQVLSEYLGLS